MHLLSKNTALIIIDVQNGWDDSFWGRRNNVQAEENIARLLDLWRRTQRPVIHVQHLSESPTSPLRPNQSGCEIKKIVQPHPQEPVFTKNVNSSFIGTNLESYLRKNTINTLVITGLTTDHCVSTTTRMAGNLGFEVYLVADATACFDRFGYDGRRYPAEEVYAISLASLHEEFATVIDTERAMEMASFI